MSLWGVETKPLGSFAGGPALHFSGAYFQLFARIEMEPELE